MREVTSYPGLLTFDEFLAIEARNNLRHEFVGGMLHAMAGATERHNIIAANVLALLWNVTGNSGCRVVGSDMLIKVAEDAAYYPDVSVICDPTDTEPTFKTRPCLIVEVTSPSTTGVDLRDKLLGYRRIEALLSYIIVFQDERRVIHNYRDADGVWRQEQLSGTGALQVRCPEAILTLEDMYRGVSDLNG